MSEQNKKINSLETKKKHILIVDDEEGIRNLLEVRLIRMGFMVSVAATGRHALQKIKAQIQFDLVICDLKMPGGGGLDFFKSFKKEFKKNIPFLMLTGFPEKRMMTEAIQLGITDVILKPVRHVELMEKINRSLACKVNSKEDYKESKPIAS